MIVFGVLIVQIVTVTLAAYAFARVNFTGKNVLFILFLLQLMIQPEILLFPNYQVISQLGFRQYQDCRHDALLGFGIRGLPNAPDV